MNLTELEKDVLNAMDGSYEREIMGYVEYSSDHKPVPNWCPILVKEDK